GGDAAEAWRLGDGEGGVEIALVAVELAGLGEGALGGVGVGGADLAEVGADRAPGLAAARLGEPDEHEGEEADQHVGADAVVFAVEDGPEQERAFEVAEGALGLLELLVAERDVLG